MLHQLCPKLGVQRQDHLTVGFGGERGLAQQRPLQRAVVVDFSIDGQKVSVDGVSQRLRSARDIDNGQSLVRQNGGGRLDHT